MTTILALGIVWTFYGFLGILGFQIIPDKCKGKSWTKSYIRSQGLIWMLLGVTWLVIYAVTHNMDLKASTMCIIIILAALPTLTYSFYNDKKYKKLMKE